MLRFNVGDLVTTENGRGMYIWVVKNTRDNPEEYDIKAVGSDNQLWGEEDRRLGWGGIGWFHQNQNNFIKWTPPEPEAPIAASEPVYVYVAYMVSVNTQNKQAISHPDEERFLSMVDSWERQGYVVKAKKRIKFNVN